MAIDPTPALSAFSMVRNSGVPTISAAIIVKNEELVLDKCLSSLAGIDEIVVVDTGSEDRTPDIARKYTDKVSVGEFSWIDNFSAARNFAAAKCTQDWIIVIDADEELEPGGIEKARQAVLANPQALVLGFRCVSAKGVMEHNAPRIFRNNFGIKYIGAIHNHLSRLADKNVDIKITYGYSPAHQKDPDRALRILTREVDKNPLHARNLFYLAREYWYRKDWPRAIELYDRCLATSKWGPEIAEAHLMKAKCLLMLKRPGDARAEIMQALIVNADFKEAWTLAANLSGPNNKARLLEHAAICQNRDVLFVRSATGAGVA